MVGFSFEKINAFERYKNVNLLTDPRIFADLLFIATNNKTSLNIISQSKDKPEFRSKCINVLVDEKLKILDIIHK